MCNTQLESLANAFLGLVYAIDQCTSCDRVHVQASPVSEAQKEHLVNNETAGGEVYSSCCLIACSKTREIFKYYTSKHQYHKPQQALRPPKIHRVLLGPTSQRTTSVLECYNFVAHDIVCMFSDVSRSENCKLQNCVIEDRTQGGGS